MDETSPSGTVTEHYFHPDQEKVRSTLQKTMPNLFSTPESGGESVRDEMRRLLENMTAKTLKKDRSRLLELMALI
jgi:transcription initiation factor IIE alpha subunit